MKTRVEILSEIPEKVDFLEEFGEYDPALFVHKKMKTNEETSLEILPAIRNLIANTEPYTHDALHDAFMQLAADSGLKNGQVMWPARVALTGKDVTPGGAVEMAEILGREESLRRIDFSMELLKKALGK